MHEAQLTEGLSPYAFLVSLVDQARRALESLDPAAIAGIEAKLPLLESGLEPGLEQYSASAPLSYQEAVRLGEACSLLGRVLDHSARNLAVLLEVTAARARARATTAAFTYARPASSRVHYPHRAQPPTAFQPTAIQLTGSAPTTFQPTAFAPTAFRPTAFQPPLLPERQGPPPWAHSAMPGISARRP